jgi:SHS2 domain-containing protein
MRHFRVTFPGEARLIATAHAEPRNSQKHKPRLVVKAVTYHQLRILKEGSKWMAEVYVDV